MFFYDFSCTSHMFYVREAMGWRIGCLFVALLSSRGGMWIAFIVVLNMEEGWRYSFTVEEKKYA